MKYTLLLFLSAALLSSCQNKKIETTSETDSTAIDTLTRTVAVQLAFSPIDNYALKSSTKLPDSVTFMIIASQDEFNTLFTPLKISGSETGSPDFVINHTIAIVTQPTDVKTTIEVEKVELGESTINVFTRITRGEKGPAVITPARVFSVEKRDGVTGMEFYVNGRLASALMLPSF